MFARSLLLILVLVVGLTLAHPAASTEATYDTKFDNVDIDEVLASDRLLTNYVKCLEREGPCTPDGKMLRETLPDAISNECAKCSEKQKTGSEKVMHFLIDNKPQDWEQLEKLYDPQGGYRKAYLEQKASGAKADQSGA